MLIERTQTARVVHLALNRPQKRNALNQALCHELVQALEAADADGSIGAIVLSGNGRPSAPAWISRHRLTRICLWWKYCTSAFSQLSIAWESR